MILTVTLDDRRLFRSEGQDQTGSDFYSLLLWHRGELRPEYTYIRLGSRRRIQNKLTHRTLISPDYLRLLSSRNSYEGKLNRNVFPHVFAVGSFGDIFHRNLYSTVHPRWYQIRAQVEKAGKLYQYFNITCI